LSLKEPTGGVQSSFCGSIGGRLIGGPAGLHEQFGVRLYPSVAKPQALPGNYMSSSDKACIFPRGCFLSAYRKKGKHRITDQNWVRVQKRGSVTRGGVTNFVDAGGKKQNQSKQKGGPREEGDRISPPTQKKRTNGPASGGKSKKTNSIAS